MWTSVEFPGRRYGHLTSNVVESMNNFIASERELPIVRILDEIWHLVMVQHSSRADAALKAAEKGEAWTAVVTAGLARSRSFVHTNRVSIHPCEL
jgi:hypothetical protein